MTIQLFRNHLRNTFVTVGYKVTAKKSVGGIEADDVDKTKSGQSTLYNANTGLQPLVSSKIVLLLQLLINNVIMYLSIH